MSDYFRYGHVRYKGSSYEVTWNSISHEVYVDWAGKSYYGKAYSLQGALDTALSWLNER